MNNLQKYRVLKNITQVKLADELKISVLVIHNIERKNQLPKIHIMNRICQYFNVSMNQMFLPKEGN